MLLAICSMFALLLFIRVRLMTRLTLTGAAYTSVWDSLTPEDKAQRMTEVNEAAWAAAEAAFPSPFSILIN